MQPGGRGRGRGRGGGGGGRSGKPEWATGSSPKQDFDFEAAAANLPPLRQQIHTFVKTVMTMEELEQGFGHVQIERVRVPSPFTEPPGLREAAQRPVQLFVPPQVPILWANPTSPTPIISMPHPDAIGDREADEHAGLMSFYEQEGIRHIHVAQLTCDNPHAEDFYYLERVEREKRQSDSNSVLYFPLPQPTARHRRRQEERAARRRERERERQEREKLGEVAPKVDQLAPNHSLLQGVLGRVQRSSSRKPRPLLQVPPGTRAIAQGSSLLLAELSEERLYLQVLSMAEKLLALGEDDGAQAASLLGLVSGGEDSGELDRYLHVHLLGSHKGRRAIGHALRLLSPILLDKWMERFMQTLEYLSLFSPQAEPSEAEHFIRTILSALVSHVALADWLNLCTWLETFLSRPAFLWMAMNRAGLVLLCILLSRGEILKQEEEEDEEEEEGAPRKLNGGAEEWHSRCNQLFEALGDRLVDFFPPTAPHGDYYVWQLMALLALSQESAESRRVMVVELRDRIMGVIEGGDAIEIDHLNVFLNAIGLDASQLQ